MVYFIKLPQVESWLHGIINNAKAFANPARQIYCHGFSLQFEQRLAFAVGLQHRPEILYTHFRSSPF